MLACIFSFPIEPTHVSTFMFDSSGLWVPPPSFQQWWLSSTGSCLKLRATSCKGVRDTFVFLLTTPKSFLAVDFLQNWLKSLCHPQPVSSSPARLWVASSRWTAPLTSSRWSPRTRSTASCGTLLPLLFLSCSKAVFRPVNIVLLFTWQEVPHRPVGTAARRSVLLPALCQWCLQGFDPQCTAGALQHPAHQHFLQHF